MTRKSDEATHQENAEKIEEFRELQQDFSRKVYQIHLNKFEHVAEVFDTEKISGVTLGELKNEFITQFRKHVDKTTVNIHKIKPDDIIIE